MLRQSGSGLKLQEKRNMAISRMYLFHRLSQRKVLKISQTMRFSQKKNLTQEDLAALVEISPTHVSVIERGTKIPRMDTFVAIANVLEVSADSLLVDVVDHATKSVATELSAAIENLPHDEKMRILKVVSALIEK